MNTVLALITFQGLIGALDNIWHHELTEKLQTRPTARNELALHTVREFIYAIIFTSIAWFTWEGRWVWVLAGLLVIEIIVTLWDFIVEDQTRKLPRFERILHTVLAINFGAILAFFIPVMMTWGTQPTEFARVDYGVYSWVLTTYGLGVFLWALHDVMAVFRLSIPQWQRHPIKPGIASVPRRVLVTGATGFIGSSLTRNLIKRGDHPVVLTRDPARASHMFGPHVTIIESLSKIRAGASIDAIINLAGEPTLGGLWTKARKKKLVRSRVELTSEIVELIERLPHKPEVLVTGSAIGFYGNRGDERLTEAAAPQNIFMSDLCRKWEEEAIKAEAYGVRVCRMRIGLVFGRASGAFPALVRPIRYGLGAVFGGGHQWMSWIHRNDLVRLILFALDTKTLSGALNAVAPQPVTNRTFNKAVADRLRRPLLFRIPKPLLTVPLGDLADLFVEGQRVIPEKALKSGFKFQFETLDKALGDLLGKNKAGPIKVGTCDLFFNDTCTVCNAEIDQYKKAVKVHKAAVAFLGVSTHGETLNRFGLEERHLRRRLYALDQNGGLHGGVDAFRTIWSMLPRHQWAAKCLENRALYATADFLYEGMAAPILYAWSNMTRRRRIPAPEKYEEIGHERNKNRFDVV